MLNKIIDEMNILASVFETPYFWCLCMAMTISCFSLTENL